MIVFHAFFTALAFFTRFPVPHKFQGSFPLKGALFFAPLMGALVGLIASTMILLNMGYEIPYNIFPDSFILKLALFLLPILLTGGLHLDGLADSADALFYAGDKSRRLEIMRDTKLGVYGVCALVIDLLIRWKCADHLVGSSQNLVWIVIMTPFIGKIGILFVMGLGKASKENGSFSNNLASPILLLPALIYAGIAFYFWQQNGDFENNYSWQFFVPFVVIVSFWAYKKVGCVTGDLCGFINEVWELGFLLAVLHRSMI